MPWLSHLSFFILFPENICIYEAKANLLHMKQEIPLSQEELAAVDNGLAALEKLCEKQIDVPNACRAYSTSTQPSIYPPAGASTSAVKRGF
jgi:hypothetical protein